MAAPTLRASPGAPYHCSMRSKAVLAPVLAVWAIAPAMAGCESEGLSPAPLPPIGSTSPGPTSPPNPNARPLEHPHPVASYLMESTIAAGLEVQRCKFLTVPDEGVKLNRATMEFTEGSHHVVLYLTAYTADKVPTVDAQGVPRDTSGVFDCPYGPGSWNTVRGVTGAGSGAPQNVVDLPLDVALTLPPRSLLLLNSHYINAAPVPLATQVKLALYGIPEAQVRQEAGFASFPDNYIRVLPFAKGSTRMRCPIPQDITVLMVGGHMHKHGVTLAANLLDPQGAAVQQLYETNDWQHVRGHWWHPGVQVKAGSWFEFQCDYVNQTPGEVLYGQTTENEMCVLLSMYYPWDPMMDACATDTMPGSGGNAGIYFGTGTATCKDTMSCLLEAKPPEQDDGESSIACMQASCPGSGPAVSALYVCEPHSLSADCDSVCHASTAALTCKQCLLAKCAADVSACDAAACD
jgi:Copper type II ascorbate-dependent monooxygenase, C-terminal domain